MVHFKIEYRFYFLCEKVLQGEKGCSWHVCVNALQNQKKNFVHDYVVQAMETCTGIFHLR